ncbi:SDR family oxidoreductase [Photobacterium sp. OFAV2-7]|uniref:SDR family oxidoreductase n=1 Tax=Photobacterium sp. OFAV2-7 TaxID=2917748 RepID=UPI001EF5A1D6|nr:SDR family oxidoreductase [Photobacterium sp. OFAV2-7]MCG7587233.1 SDR family oxidoreductase [Photobacterium sp. OFAV2-7]
MSNKTVLITGCSSGFGRLATKTFQKNGWNVIATMRSSEKETELTQLKNVLVTTLDVTRQETIDDAVAKGLDTFGSIDVLVNNAGFGGHAMFEQFTEDQIESMFDTNVYGPMRVARAVLPHFRKQRSGCIINVTSMAGEIGLPCTTTYSASKFAMQGWSEGLAMELVPFNIKVHTIAPGAFGTNFNEATNNNITAGDEELQKQAQKVATHFVELAAQMQRLGGKDADPQDVADIIYQCATQPMPIHNAVGADAAMLLDMKLSLPREEFLQKMQEMLLPN